MKQMDIPAGSKVNIDFDDKTLPEAVRTLQPILFREENGFKCVLGSDMQQGIVGTGDTVEKALLDWEAHMRKRIIYPKGDDELARFVIDKLNASNKDTG